MQLTPPIGDQCNSSKLSSLVQALLITFIKDVYTACLNGG